MMMFMTMTLMAAVIAVMFVSTAVSSIINSVREDESDKVAAARRLVVSMTDY